MAVRKELVQLSEELFESLLRDFKKLLDEGQATAADRATLARLLTQNGYSVNPNELPDDLKNTLTTQFDPKADLDEQFGRLRAV